MKSAGGTYGAMRRYFGSMPSEQAGHGRVAGRHHVADHVAVYPGLLDQLVDDAVDRVDDRLLQALSAARLLRVHDAGDDVLAEAHLVVVVRSLSEGHAAVEVEQLPPDRRGADVEHDRVVEIALGPRLHIDDLVPVGRVDHGGRHCPVLLAQHAGHVPDPDGVDRDIGETELVLEALLEPGQVVEIVTLGRRRELHAELSRPPGRASNP